MVVTHTHDGTHCFPQVRAARLEDMKQPDEGNLFTDLMEFGPAPTMARELVVAVVSAALLVAVLVATEFSTAVCVVAVVAALYMAGRFALGVKTWRARS